MQESVKASVLMKKDPVENRQAADDSVDPTTARNLDEGLEHPPPLSAEQAAMLRQQPGFQTGSLSATRLLFWLLGAGLVVAAVATLLTQNRLSAISALYGMLAVVMPGAVFVWGLKRWQRLADRSGVSSSGKGSAVAGSMLAGFFVWELVKIVLTIVMLALAVKVVVPLDWLALLAGFVVTLKMHWLALWLSTKAARAAVGKV